MTQPAGRLTSQDVADFIAAQGFETFSSRNGKLPQQPDAVVIITQTGGQGLQSDGVLDDVDFQLRFRGAQRDEDSAELMAWTVDQMLVPPPGQPPLGPGLVGSQFVSRIERAQGPPRYLTRDSAQRTHIVCYYTFTVSRVSATA